MLRSSLWDRLLCQSETCCLLQPQPWFAWQPQTRVSKQCCVSDNPVCLVRPVSPSLFFSLCLSLVFHCWTVFSPRLDAITSHWLYPMELMLCPGQMTRAEKVDICSFTYTPDLWESYLYPQPDQFKLQFKHCSYLNCPKFSFFLIQKFVSCQTEYKCSYNHQRPTLSGTIKS